MRYLVRLLIDAPFSVDPEIYADFVERHNQYLSSLLDEGLLEHAAQVASSNEEILLLKASDNEQLHELVRNAPLARFATVRVTPLIAHPGL